MKEKIRYCSKKRWLGLWRRLGASLNSATIEAYRELVKSYSEPHRKYHNIYHIDSCLAELEEVKSLAINADALELAIWYHDAVYSLSANDNEEQSAILAERVMTNFDLPKELISKVVEIILATKHNSSPDDFDAKLMLDIDIANIGKLEQFKVANRLIREEYSLVPEKVFVEGRSNILEVFLKRPIIYLSDYFYSRYEASARKNIADSIAGKFQ